MPSTTLLQNTSGRNDTLTTKNSAQNTTTSTASEISMTINACCQSAILRKSWNLNATRYAVIASANARTPSVEPRMRSITNPTIKPDPTLTLCGSAITQ